MTLKQEGDVLRSEAVYNLCSQAADSGRAPAFLQKVASHPHFPLKRCVIYRGIPEGGGVNDIQP